MWNRFAFLATNLGEYSWNDYVSMEGYNAAVVELNHFIIKFMINIQVLLTQHQFIENLYYPEHGFHVRIAVK